MTSAINLQDKFSRFSDYWSPRIIAQINDYQVRVARVKGEFVWHSHPETDELFLVHRGTLRIELRDGAVTLGPGEIYVVAKGVEHKPVAEREAHILMFEPAGTLNTGNVQDERTMDQVERI